jgi:hypothetical protein
MRRLKAAFSILFVATIVLTLALVFIDVAAALITIVSLAATLLIVWLVLPLRYELWPDRLRVVFPAWKWDIAYDGIRSVRPGRWYEAYGFAGVRFATAPSQSVTILRHDANLFRRPNLVISPEDREVFLRELERAMQNAEQRS